jgi:glycosyltransferase involved in cell wall biosynthesis
MSLVSILIPAYNADRWISETINSALIQTWNKKEIIIVDDGSTDNTLQIARQFESKLVKVVTQENSGAASARNKAFKFAQGDYIQWLDADDLLAPDKIYLQMQRREVEANELILYTAAWARFYFRPGSATFYPDSLWCDLQPLEWLVSKFEKGVWMNPITWLVSRKLSELAGSWDERLSLDDDGEYVSRLVAQSEGVRFVSEAKCFYRTNTNSLSSTRSDAALDSLFLATTLCIKHLRALEDTDHTRSACLKLLEARLCYFHPAKPAIIKAAEKLASDIGGTLRPPEMSREMRLVGKIIGWEIAMRTKNGLWAIEIQSRKYWDRIIDMLCSLHLK